MTEKSTIDPKDILFYDPLLMDNNFAGYVFTYVLQCNNNQVYCGITKDLLLRLKQHRAGLSISTKRFKSISLLMCMCFKTRGEARQLEEFIKNFGVKKYYNSMKLDIINGKHKNSNIIYFRKVLLPL